MKELTAVLNDRPDAASSRRVQGSRPASISEIHEVAGHGSQAKHARDAQIFANLLPCFNVNRSERLFRLSRLH